MKYLIWLVVLLAVVVWFQRAKKSMLAGSDAAGDAARGTARDSARDSAREAGETGMPKSKASRFRRSADGGAETMVQCAHCGIHFPVSEAVVHASGAHYCSEEHRHQASF